MYLTRSHNSIAHSCYHETVEHNDIALSESVHKTQISAQRLHISTNNVTP